MNYMIGAHILEQVVEYLSDMAVHCCEYKSREWWAYQDAIWLCHEATVALERDADRGWRRFKGEQQ